MTYSAEVCLQTNTFNYLNQVLQNNAIHLIQKVLFHWLKGHSIGYRCTVYDVKPFLFNSYIYVKVMHSMKKMLIRHVDTVPLIGRVTIQE